MKAFVLALTVFSLTAWGQSERTSEVNPFIGTGGTFYLSGMNHPGASVPFGMVRLGPDTKFGFPLLNPLNNAAMATSGYSYSHGKLVGFSHTRLIGTGMKEGGAFRVLPLSAISSKDAKKGVTLAHKLEEAAPGVYRLQLEKEKVSAELTATAHCGVHRYSAGNGLALLIDPASNLTGSKNAESELVLDGNHFVGRTYVSGEFSRRYGGHPLFAYGEVSQMPASTLKDENGTWMYWPGQSSIELKLCLSLVSQVNARKNFVAEVEGLNFAAVGARANSAWDQWLGRISIKSDSAKVREVFYSALYRSAQMPTAFQDVNGEYRGFKNTIGKTSSAYYSDLSLWDSFRTVHPLYTLIAPEVQADVLSSLIIMSKEHGDRFPIWPSGPGEGGSMFGHPAHFLFAEAWAKGFRNFDPQEVLRIMSNKALDPESPCVKYHFCPTDQMGLAVSKTLEIAWANGVASEFAKSVGETTTAAQFEERSLDFRNLWDEKKRFFAPKKASGEMLRYFPGMISYIDFAKLNHHAYAEGSPHQWRYSAPHRVQELIELFGGKEAFLNELTEFMQKSSQFRSSPYPGAHYWHGNEHDLHTPYLFIEAGRPDLTQYWVRWALDTRYGTGPGGLDGNDDGGTLSAWYVLSAIGLYPQAGTDKYWVGSPRVDEAELDLGAGRKLSIKAMNNSPSHRYVESVTLNGKRICGASVRHVELQGELVFKMSHRPQKDCAH